MDLTEQPSESFGQLLRHFRMCAQLTQEELAAAASVSPRAVSDLERGVNRSARKETARLLADALKLVGPTRASFEAAARGSVPTNGLAVPGMQVGSMAAATRTLPRNSASFIGREPELRRLVGAIEAGDASSGAVGIYAIGGMAGIGKTALAVHAAHQLAPRFVDGQIFLPLYGHAPAQRPIDPADALASLLLTVGVAAERIPPGLEPRTRLWRHHVADKQLLLLLDDAVGHEQVRPLLPGTAGSLVLITSRRHLTALEDTQTISLDILPVDEAAELLVRLATRPGLDPGDAAVAEITRLCGYLPLAIGMLARQLHHHPAWTAAGLATDLASARDRLEFMQAENLSMTAAFDLSYQDLTEDEQRLFRRLGLYPGTDIDAYAAAALDDTDLSTARRNLDALYDQYLITEPARGRYRLHDLISERARALAATEPVTDGYAAFGRLLNYYLHTARTADQHLARRTATAMPSVKVIPPRHAPNLLTREDAVAWMDAERLNLHAAADYAASHELTSEVRAISSAMHGFLRSKGHWDQARSLHHTALELARRVGDELAEADALTDLGTVQQATAEYTAAITSLTQAIRLHRNLDNRLGEANALNRLGVVEYLTTDYPAATASLKRALELYQSLGDHLGEANALTDLGVVQYLTGYYPAAITSRTRALELYRGLGYQLGEASALTDLGVVQRVIGDYPAATANHSRALVLYRELGYHIGEANTLNNLSVVQRVTGDYSASTASITKALKLWRDAGYRLGEANAMNHLGAVQRITGDYSAAAASLSKALKLCRDLGYRLGEAGTLNNLGMLQRVTGNYSAAATSLAKALELCRELGHRQGQAEALNAMGELWLAMGVPTQALSHHNQALTIANDIKTIPEAARALEGIGRSYLRTDQRHQATTPLRQALTLYNKMDARSAEQVEATLRDYGL